MLSQVAQQLDCVFIFKWPRPLNVCFSPTENKKALRDPPPTLLNPWGSRVGVGDRGEVQEGVTPEILWHTQWVLWSARMLNVECWPMLGGGGGGANFPPRWTLTSWTILGFVQLKNSLSQACAHLLGRIWAAHCALSAVGASRPGVHKVNPICIRITRRNKRQPWVQLQCIYIMPLQLPRTGRGQSQPSRSVSARSKRRNKNKMCEHGWRQEEEEEEEEEANLCRVFLKYRILNAICYVINNQRLRLRPLLKSFW